MQITNMIKYELVYSSITEIVYNLNAPKPESGHMIDELGQLLRIRRQKNQTAKQINHQLKNICYSARAKGDNIRPSFKRLKTILLDNYYIQATYFDCTRQIGSKIIAKNRYIIHPEDGCVITRA